MASLFERLDLDAASIERTPDEEDQLIALSALVCRARSAVERDGHTREIELIGDPETPTRLAIVLDRLRSGLRAIGCNQREAWRLTVKVGLDSIPATRRAVLEVLDDGERRSTATVATKIGYPTGTARRMLEDLAAHGVVKRYSAKAPGEPDRWRATRWTMSRLSEIGGLDGGGLDTR